MVVLCVCVQNHMLYVDKVIEEQGTHTNTRLYNDIEPHVLS